MGRFLIVYGTKEGQTKKIASFIGEEIIRCGHSFDIFDSQKIPNTVLPENYDAVILGGSVHMREFPKSLEKWIRLNADSLQKIPSAFFSVCLGILDTSEIVQKDEKQIVENFFARTKWHPPVWTIFAGSVQFSKYNWLVRKIMLRITKKETHKNLDPHLDYEYTHWNSVRQFAVDFMSHINEGAGHVL